MALVDPWSLQTDTFVKVYQNFKFYWNLRAGHMVSLFAYPSPTPSHPLVVYDVITARYTEILFLFFMHRVTSFGLKIKQKQI